MEQIRFEYSFFSVLQTFRKRILEFARPRPNSTFNVPNSVGLTYLTRLRVHLSHLRKHKLHHDFRDSLNPICKCGNAIKSTKHHLLHCLNCKNERQSLLQNVTIANLNLLSNTLTDNVNTFLLISAIEYITSTTFDFAIKKVIPLGDS